MMARPGSGKTATIMRVAREHFLVFMNCCTPHGRLVELHDDNFVTMAEDVVRDNVISALHEWNSAEALVEWDAKMKRIAEARATTEILGRLMFLLLLLRQAILGLSNFKLPVPLEADQTDSKVSSALIERKKSGRCEIHIHVRSSVNAQKAY